MKFDLQKNKVIIVASYLNFKKIKASTGFYKCASRLICFNNSKLRNARIIKTKII